MTTIRRFSAGRHMMSPTLTNAACACADTTSISSLSSATSLSKSMSAFQFFFGSAYLGRALPGRNARLGIFYWQGGSWDRSPDGAKRNPGPPSPHCASLHAGYSLLRFAPLLRELGADERHDQLAVLVGGGVARDHQAPAGPAG